MKKKTYAKYYKTKDGHGWLGFKPNVSDEVLERDYIPLTEEEWQAHLDAINVVHEPTAEELHQREINGEIAHAKAYLRETDWVIVKIAEETNPDEIAALREKYADVIEQRKAKRAEINELEGNL